MKQSSQVNHDCEWRFWVMLLLLLPFMVALEIAVRVDEWRRERRRA